MSILTYPLGFLGGGDDEFYNGVMENSLRTENGDSPKLYRTVSAGGDRTTWTASFWLKNDLTGYSGSNFLFEGGDDNNAAGRL